MSLKYSRREAVLQAHDRTSADGEQHQDALEREHGRGEEHGRERSSWEGLCALRNHDLRFQ